MLMEHSTSAVNWQPVNPAKAPGQTIRDSLAHVARGADTVGYFQWRQSRAGSEKFHSALVPHAGADSARYREVCRLGEILGRLGELAGSRVEADAAILWDYESAWATAGPGMPSSHVDYAEAAHTIHRLLLDRGVTCDVVHPSADLTAYRLIIVPTTYLISDEEAEALEKACAAGAVVLVTYFSGISDRHDHVRLGGYPGAFRDLLGVRVEEFFPLLDDERVGLSSGGTGSRWSEHLTVRKGVDLLLTLTNGPLAGGPAATVAEHGHGRAAYLATLPDPSTLGTLLDTFVDQAGIERLPSTSSVEVVRRRGANGSWLFVLNHSDAPAEVGGVRGHDLVSETDVSGLLCLAAGETAVVREARP